jgi:hypothetical protein
MTQQGWWILGLLVAVGIPLGPEVRAQEVPDPPAHIDGWGWAVDPDGTSTFRVDDGKLTIVAPGPIQDLSIELGRMNAPRIMRRVEGDFIAQVKVDGRFGPGKEQTLRVRTPYHGAGLLLMKDLQTYVRIDRATVVRGAAEQHYVAFEHRERGEAGEPTGIVLEEGEFPSQAFQLLGSVGMGFLGLHRLHL